MPTTSQTSTAWMLQWAESRPEPHAKAGKAAKDVQAEAVIAIAGDAAAAAAVRGAVQAAATVVMVAATAVVADAEDGKNSSRFPVPSYQLSVKAQGRSDAALFSLSCIFCL